MKKEIGLWIDHREAILVMIQDGKEEIKKIESNMEKHVRFTDKNAYGEDIRDRQFENHLNHYYDEVITHIGDAEAIQIFGPGEAKLELKSRIEHLGIKANVTVEAADKMTENQISAKVREHFSK